MRDEVASVIPHKLEEKADECPVESIGIEKDKLLEQLRNDKTIISSISVADIVFDVYMGKWNYRAIPKVKT